MGGDLKWGRGQGGKEMGRRAPVYLQEPLSSLVISPEECKSWRTEEWIMLGPDHAGLRFSSTECSQMPRKTKHCMLFQTLSLFLSLIHTHTHTHTHTSQCSSLYPSLCLKNWNDSKEAAWWPVYWSPFSPFSFCVREQFFWTASKAMSLSRSGLIQTPLLPVWRRNLFSPCATIPFLTGWLHIENIGRCDAPLVVAPGYFSKPVLSTQASTLFLAEPG